MRLFKANRLLIATVLYWFLLLYIMAGLVWWFIALEQQNRQVALYRTERLRPGDPDYLGKLERIKEEASLKTAQYSGEGATFLCLFLAGAFLVYLPVRRQLKMQELQQNFMMAVTHELKTPIAVAKLNLETLLKYQLDETKRRQVIESALEETNRLNTLASNILVSAQLEEPGHRVARERLDFSALVENICRELRTRIPQRLWEIRIDPRLTLAGDPLLLRMLVNNILENAIKYSPPDSPLSIDLHMEGNHVVLRIADQGIRIPGSEKKRIFDKFYRLGNEGTRVAQGTGLGLWLCKKIASDHRARITVSDNSPAGTIFAIIFQKGNPRG